MLNGCLFYILKDIFMVNVNSNSAFAHNYTAEHILPCGKGRLLKYYHNNIARNSANPYDFVGQVHNEFCVQLLNKYIAKQAFPKNIREILIEDFCLSYRCADYIEEVFEYNITAIENENFQFHPDILQALKSNIRFEEVNIALFEIINNQRLSMEGIIEEIKNLESNVMGFSEHEKAIVFQVTAVARHATYFWFLNFDKLQQNVGSSAANLRHIIGSDAAGLWGGGITGAILGGPVLGAPFGIAGMVGCSISAFFS